MTRRFIIKNNCWLSSVVHSEAADLFFIYCAWIILYIHGQADSTLPMQRALECKLTTLAQQGSSPHIKYKMYALNGCAYPHGCLRSFFFSKLKKIIFWTLLMSWKRMHCTFTTPMLYHWGSTEVESCWGSKASSCQLELYKMNIIRAKLYKICLRTWICCSELQT